MALEDLSPVDFNARAKELSLLSSQMKPHAQYHLFRNKTITFNGSGGTQADGKRFNDWCETMAWYHQPSRVSGTATVIDPLSPLFGSIWYNGNPTTHLRPDSNEYIRAFTNVKTLKLSNLHFKYLQFIPNFHLLGNKIETLTFMQCTMGFNEFIGYLLPFKNLKHLAINEVNFIRIGAQIKTEIFRRALPPFTGTLSLESDETSEFFIGMLNEIPKMNHTRIIFGRCRGGLLPGKVLDTFLSKFRDTLTHLRINDHWGHFKVSQLTKLQTLVIDVVLMGNSIGAFRELGGPFPPSTIELVLVLVFPPASFKFSMSEKRWKGIDEALMSLDLSHRNVGSKLHFFMVGHGGDANVDHLPEFKKRDEILVDETLINRLRLDIVG